MTAKHPDASILVCAQYLSEGSGGIAQVARMTATALRRRNKTTAMSCMDPSDFVFDDVAVRSFGGSRARFVWHLMRTAPSVSHVIHDFAGTARAQQLVVGARSRTAIWAHGLEIWDRPRQDYLKALRRADLVLVNSAYNLTRAEATLKGLREVRLCQLATTSDVAPASVGPTAGRPTVLLLGRIDHLRGKGHDLLIDIWPKVVSTVPDALLLFAGGGEALDQMRAVASRSPVAGSIEVLGYVPAPAIDSIWRRSTVLAMPSLAEGFGLVYIEAMRRGLPVIASREDAGQEINIDGVTGFNLTRSNPAAIADALIWLLGDHDAATRLGAAGHAHWQANYRFSGFERRLAMATAEFLVT